MTFEQLEYFIAAAKGDTFFNVAESLHISQSVLSKKIIKLEKELEIQLFDRTKRSASLTEGGKIFYDEAVKLYEEYLKTLSKMKKYKMEKRDEIHIGTLPILTQYNLTLCLKDFKERYPDIHIHINEVEEAELLNGIEMEKYDLVIAREYMLNSKKYHNYPLLEDELMVVVSDSSKFSKEITLEEIKDEKFILMNNYTSIFQLSMELFEKAGIQPDIVRNARAESIVSAVSVGEGISLLPKSYFKVFHYDNLVYLPLKPPVKLPVLLAVKEGKESSSLKKLLNYLREKYI